MDVARGEEDKTKIKKAENIGHLFKHRKNIKGGLEANPLVPHTRPLQPVAQLINKNNHI